MGSGSVNFLTLVAVAHRQRLIVPPAPPAELGAAWHDDPTGRFDKRHWNGRQWSAPVVNASDKKGVYDPPTTLDHPNEDEHAE